MKFAENSKFKTDLKFRFFEIGAIGRRWENSRLTTPVDRPVDWAVDLARTKSTALSTWVSTGVLGQFGLMHHFWVGLCFGAVFWKLPRSDGPNLI